MRTPILVALLIAFALRLYHLEAQPIWGDEAFSIFVARQDVGYIVAPGADVHPPLYHLLLHGWIGAAGASPFAVRFLSVVPSLLMAAVAFALARASLPATFGALT